MSFRTNLQYLRAERHMTQEQLAMLLGVSRQSVTKWEAEKAYPEMDKLIKMCQIFECSLDDLVQGDVSQRGYGVRGEDNERRRGDVTLTRDGAMQTPSGPAASPHVTTFAPQCPKASSRTYADTTSTWFHLLGESRRVSPASLRALRR